MFLLYLAKWFIHKMCPLNIFQEINVVWVYQFSGSSDVSQCLSQPLSHSLRLWMSHNLKSRLQSFSTLAFLTLLEAISEIIRSYSLLCWLWELVCPPRFVPFGFGTCSHTVYLAYWPGKPLRFASTNCLRLLWLQIPNRCPDQASETPPAPFCGKEIIFDFFG